MTRLGIGTAQFGMPYGATNTTGRVQPSAVREILERAAELGVDLVDTAAAYGESEAVLGRAMEGLDFRIVTKLKPLGKSSIGESDVAAARRGLDESLERLRVPMVDTVLVHHADEALAEGGERLVEMLGESRERGIIRRFGFSVYDGAQIDALLERYAFDVIQLPDNVFDQRLYRSGHLQKLDSAGVEVHVRSAFLQGVLVTPASQLPARTAYFRDKVRDFHARVEAAGLTPVQAALGYFRQLDDLVDAVVVGVVSVEQLEEAVDALGERPAVDYSGFAEGDARMLNPSNWPS